MAGEHVLNPIEVEDTELVPVCNECGNELMRVVTHTDPNGINYQIVSGSFIQALDDEGNEYGPRWGFCLPCVEADRKILPTEYLKEQ